VLVELFGKTKFEGVFELNFKNEVFELRVSEGNEVRSCNFNKKKRKNEKNAFETPVSFTKKYFFSILDFRSLH
jgi:hypothetical protein